ncbi:GIY-YIG nuclease family protein [Priestia aryabhattai]
MNKFETPLLPYISPTKSYKIWQLDEISKHKGVGVYVFWDKSVIDNDKYTEQDRFSYTFEDEPLYIGRADNLGKRITNHIMGKTHTEPYSCYFHTVDLYEMKDTKTMKEDHKNYNAFEEIEKLQEIMHDNNGLNENAITDFYELYFILLRLPFFNERSNYFTADKYINYTYKNRYITQHRRNWAKKEVINTSGNTVEQFLQNKGIKVEQWYSLEEFIDKIMSKWYVKRQDKKEFLKLKIEEQVKSNLFPPEVTKGSLLEGTFQIAKEYVIFYDILLSKGNFRKEFENSGLKW